MDAGSETDDETSDDALEKPSFMTRLTGATRADAPADMAKQETAAIAERRPNISDTLSKMGRMQTDRIKPARMHLYRPIGLNQ